MRTAGYALAALAVAALLAASVALVMHTWPTGSPPVAQQSAPAAPESATATAPEPEPLPPAASEPAAPPVPSVPPGVRLALSPEQQDKVRFVLLSHNIVQSEAANIPLRVGETVPESVELTPLPIEIADVVPDYRAYSYVISQNRIVIVVTERREISLTLSL